MLYVTITPQQYRNGVNVAGIFQGLTVGENPSPFGTANAVVQTTAALSAFMSMANPAARAYAISTGTAAFMMASDQLGRDIAKAQQTGNPDDIAQAVSTGMQAAGDGIIVLSGLAGRLSGGLADPIADKLEALGAVIGTIGIVTDPRSLNFLASAYKLAAAEVDHGIKAVGDLLSSNTSAEVQAAAARIGAVLNNLSHLLDRAAIQADFGNPSFLLDVGNFGNLVASTSPVLGELTSPYARTLNIEYDPAQGFAAVGIDDDPIYRAMGHFASDPAGNEPTLLFQPGDTGLPTQTITYRPDRVDIATQTGGTVLYSETRYDNGGRVQTTYSSDPNTSWSQSKKIYRDDDLIGTELINRDGTVEVVAIDGATGKTVAVTFDEHGNPQTPAVEPGISYNGFVRAIADVLATQLIAKALVGNDLPATIAVQAFEKAIIATAFPDPGQQVDFATELATSTFDIAGAVVGSAAGVSVAEALGIPVEAGQLIGGATGSFVAHALIQEALHGFNLPASQVLNPSQLAGSLAAAGGAYLGELLASALVTPTEAGQVIASLATVAALLPLQAGTGIGVTYAGLLLATNPELAPLFIFAIAFGSDFIGNLIGSLFGNTHPSVGPNAVAQNAWNGSGWVMLGAQQDNGGTTDGVIAMSSALNKIMGEAIAGMGAHVMGAPPEMSMVWFKNKYYYAFDNQFPDDSPNRFNTPAEAVEAAAVRWMNTLTLVDGDPYMMFVAKHSTAAKLADFYADLNVAHVYGIYADDPVAFDVALAAVQDPTTFATWQQMLARSEALGLDQLTVAEVRGLELFGTITPDSLAQGLPLLGVATNFLGTHSHDYFVDHPANGLEVYMFDDRAGVLTDAIVLHNPDGTRFSLTGGTKILGAGRNLTGAGESDIVARDASGHILVYKVNAQAQITLGGSPTYTDGSAFLFGQTVPSYNSDAYWQMWQATLRQIGYTGPFDGVTPKTWFQATFGEPLDGNSAAGMQQLLDHVHSVKAPPVNPQFVGTADGLLRRGGVDLISEDASGHLIIHEFNAQGQAVAAKTLTYSGASPFTFTHQPIPDFNSDAYWAMWQSTLRVIGYTGPFDGKSPMAWFNATFGVGLDNHSSAGMRQLLDKVDVQSPHLIGAFDKLIADGSINLVLQDRNGHVGLNVFTAQGQIKSQVWLQNADGSSLTWQAGNDIVGKGNNLLGLHGSDLFVRHADGSLRALEIDSNGARVAAEAALFRADGTPFTSDIRETITNLGTNLLGTGGRDIFVVGVDGQVAVAEFDAADKLVANSSLYNADGGHFYLPSGTTFFANTKNFFGLNGRDLLLLNSDGTLNVVEFNPTDLPRVVANSSLYLPDGGHFVLPEGAGLLGAAKNFAGQNGQDLFFRYADGSVTFLEFSTADRPRAVAQSPLYLPDGGHFFLPQDAAFLGQTQNFTGQNGQDLLFRYADGSVHLLEFSPGDRPRALTSIALANTDGTPFILAADAHLVGSSQNLPGGSGLDLIFEASNGKVTVDEFTHQGHLVPNRAPAVANPIADQSVAEDAAWSYQVPANAFSDIDGDALVYTATLGNGSALPGWLGFNAATRTFSGTAPLNFNGPLDLKVIASDGALGTSDTFTLSIAPVNDAPIAQGAAISGSEDTVISGMAVATDVDNSTGQLSYSLVGADGGAQHGTVSLNVNGSYTYMPAANFNGTDSFLFKASDGALSSNIVAISVTVKAVNDAPVLQSRSWSGNEDSVVSGTMVTLDIDNTAAQLSYALISSFGGAGAAQHGTVSLDTTGVFTYTPHANFYGTDSFNLVVGDGLSGEIATVDVTVYPVNDAPVAQNATASGNEDSAISGSVTAADVDNAAAQLNYALVGSNGGAQHGTVSLNANGAFSYSPAANFNGSDSFSFKANDGVLNSNTANIGITVNAVNDVPAIISNGGGATATISVAENLTAVTTVAATDPDAGTSLIYSIVTGAASPDAGLFSINGATGMLSFNAARDFEAPGDADHNNNYVVQVRASDGSLFDDQTITVNVTDVPPFEQPSFSLADFGTSSGWSNNDLYPREMADVNGDGMADIVGFGNAGVLVSLATGGGHFAQPVLQLDNFGAAAGWSSNNTYLRQVADVNGDHMADIVGFGSAGVLVSLATGGGRFAQPVLQLGDFGAAAGWSSNNTYLREVADVNGDGMADIVGFGNAGVLVSLATGGGHFAQPVPQLDNFGVAAGGWSDNNTYLREVADVNGDGMADIVGFGNAGVLVSLATGGGHFAQPAVQLDNFGVAAGGWSNNNTYLRQVADVNGDHKADIVGFGAAGVLVSLAHDFLL